MTLQKYFWQKSSLLFYMNIRVHTWHTWHCLRKNVLISRPEPLRIFIKNIPEKKSPNVGLQTKLPEINYRKKPTFSGEIVKKCQNDPAKNWPMMAKQQIHPLSSLLSQNGKIRTVKYFDYDIFFFDKKLWQTKLV